MMKYVVFLENTIVVLNMNGGWEYPILAPTRFVKLWCALRMDTMGVSQRKNKEHTIL